MHVKDKQESSVLCDLHKILLDQNTYFWCKINCLKASTGKAKQPNWNKTNEMNIGLASTTVFLEQKKEKKNIGSVSVNTAIRSRTAQQCSINNQYSVTDRRDWLDQNGAVQK